MKIQIILIASLFPLFVTGQNLFSPKGVRLVSVPTNKSYLIDKPSAKSESIKIINRSIKEEGQYLIYTKEYRNQKHIENQFELTESTYVKKHSTLSWTLIPDTSDCKHIKIFSFYPSGGMALREGITLDSTKYFDYKFFHYSKELTKNQEIPLLIVYESDLKDRTRQNSVKEYLYDGKFKAEDKNKIIEIFDRYILVYYILK